MPSHRGCIKFASVFLLLHAFKVYHANIFQVSPLHTVYMLYAHSFPKLLLIYISHFGLYMQFFAFLAKIIFFHRTYYLPRFFINNPITMFHFFQHCKLFKQTVFFFSSLINKNTIRFTSIVNLINYDIFFIISIIQNLWANKDFITNTIFSFFFYLNNFSFFNPCISIT